MIRSFITALAMALAFALAPLQLAGAQITVNVGDGTAKPLPIAVPEFNAEPGEAREYGDQIAEVLRSDLRLTGLFELKKPEAFIQRDLDIGAEPRFADWKIIQTDALVVGETEMLPDGRLRVAFRLWDIYGEQVMRLGGQPGRQYVTTPENWRRIAHKIADSIYTRLTGEDGYLDTRIVYIAETGPKTARVKKLAIMDADGANQQDLTSGAHTVLTPRFSTSDQEITYMSYEGGTPRVYLFNIETGRQEVLGNFDGMTFAPRFSPDGRSVLFSQARGGNSDLYIMDLRTRQEEQLTSHPDIDTSPSMSPDGRQIVFTSDRGGSPQLYVMNRDQSALTCPSGGRDTACRITFGEGRYSTPVWSPRGDLIAFTKQLRGRFYIGVIGTDGKGERLLTESYLDEGPTWSPNGRVIAFFREARPGAGPRLWSVDLTGKNLRQLPTPTDASDPAWSPLLD
ncbi:MAG: Tol-Pal system protein TolB [Alphaproteobacteria bacterium]|jgi:TolB protein|nr:Tol-Pal system protein TolB [Alphaproteobacteria bacterium]